VIAVTELRAAVPQNTLRYGSFPMPVLMIALLALAIFGGIGILLGAAVILEHRSKIMTERSEPGIASVVKQA
jgi:hypothetical protein